MKVKDMVCKKTDTDDDYTIMHVMKIEDIEVTCSWIDNLGLQTKVFDIKELEVFVED